MTPCLHTFILLLQKLTSPLGIYWHLQSIIYALYMPAVHTEYAGPLREEVKSVLTQGGRPKMALQ